MMFLCLCLTWAWAQVQTNVLSPPAQTSVSFSSVALSATTGPGAAAVQERTTAMLSNVHRGEFKEERITIGGFQSAAIPVVTTTQAGALLSLSTTYQKGAVERNARGSGSTTKWCASQTDTLAVTLVVSNPAGEQLYRQSEDKTLSKEVCREGTSGRDAIQAINTLSPSSSEQERAYKELTTLLLKGLLPVWKGGSASFLATTAAEQTALSATVQALYAGDWPTALSAWAAQPAATVNVYNQALIYELSGNLDQAMKLYQQAAATATTEQRPLVDAALQRVTARVAEVNRLQAFGLSAVSLLK